MNKRPRFLKKIGRFFSLLGRNLVSLHRMVWGRGWKRLVIAIVVSTITLALLLLGSLEVTSRPAFCSTCHYMKPYYESWQESSHHDVTCTACHFPPGFANKLKGKFTAFSMLVNYFTGVYKKGKPWAEITDQSCMRSGCHESRLLSGKTVFKQGIIFDHEPHLNNLRRDKKLRCTSCHSQIVQGTHLSVTETSCFLCHFKETSRGSAINDCLKCHDPPVGQKGKGSITRDHSVVLEREIQCQKCHGDMVIGDGAVPKARCSNCHAEIHKLNRYDETEFMHRNHITDHKIECQQCHTEIQHKSIALTENIKPDCHACHPDFHEAPLEMFTGRGGIAVAEHPSAMFEAGLNCQACHIYHQYQDEFKDKGETYIARAESCEPCHGKGYNKILNNWQIQSQRRQRQIENVLKRTEALLEKRKNDPDYGRARRRLGDAQYNFRLVKFGKAIHNIVFANRLLTKAHELARESVEIVGLPPGSLPAVEKESDIVPGECSNCHTGIERLSVGVYGWTFPHDSHVISLELPCARCHSNDRRHGELVVSKKNCMECHHRETRGECRMCHKTQHAVITSTLPFSTLDIPNIMADTVTCRDCHQHEDRLRRSRAEDCLLCHDEGYEELFVEWVETTGKLMDRLRKVVQEEKLGPGDRPYDTLKFLERDGSRGIHNPDLYQSLIDDVLE